VGGDGEHERRGGLEQRRRDRDGEGEGQGHRRRPELGDGLVGGWITGSERWGDGESRAAAEQSVSAMACMGRIWLVWALDLGLRFWGSFFWVFFWISFLPLFFSVFFMRELRSSQLRKGLSACELELKYSNIRKRPFKA
jgi:hypothetical protein